MDRRLVQSVTCLSPVDRWRFKPPVPSLDKPSNELLCKPHHPAHHATFFTPRTKLNWTSWKLSVGIARPTYIGCYPPEYSSGLVLPDSTSLFPPGGSIISSIGDPPVLVLSPLLIIVKSKTVEPDHIHHQGEAERRPHDPHQRSEVKHLAVAPLPSFLDDPHRQPSLIPPLLLIKAAGG
ncbi:hypothetical protein AMECASPLE_015029 [Ameca splendens]|uniref:Uncharacterized protein n=1 Tax=Ameca splendens TaxID=208324 RepID=A0ABV0ZZ08_9TELE